LQVRAKLSAMYSKVKIFGHPLHPMIIAFPVAFYTAAMVSYIVYNSTLDVFWFKLAYVNNFAGVVMAAVAALPGFIDWLGIPNNIKAKSTGVLHMSANILALICFLVNMVMVYNQWTVAQPDMRYSIPLTIVGFLFTIGAGYLGWTLVQTHHIGVEPFPGEADKSTLGKPTAGVPQAEALKKGDTGSKLAPASDKNKGNK
jgi:uncharacterized membrane protein